MLDKPLKILRYNMGNDKKAFVEFKDIFDTVLFNASIVAYSGAAVADIISIHKNNYIIDPQTHFLQQDKKDFISSKKVKEGKFEIKASIQKYLNELPQYVQDVIVNEERPMEVSDFETIENELNEKIYNFQTKYINKFLKDKDYNKYFEFRKKEISIPPYCIISPYFRLKKEDMVNGLLEDWINLNYKYLSDFILFNKMKNEGHKIAAELLIDKEVLMALDVEKIKRAYNIQGYEIIFLWVDDFVPMKASRQLQNKFIELIQCLNSINKKPVMLYGGFDSIVLCHKEIKNRLFGVSQSVGYGEFRKITPVDGGIPTNKYYFYPLHERLDFSEASGILSEEGFFIGDKKTNANKYYSEICDCEQCKEIIKNDINNFEKYNDSVPFTWKSDIKRNRPTTEASYRSTRHFMFSKIKEWEMLNLTLNELITKVETDIKRYDHSEKFLKLLTWIRQNG